MPNKDTIYKIRIVYMNGYVYEFDVFDFNIENGKYSWEAVDDHNKPIYLNVSQIMAVFQVGYRKTRFQ